MKIIGIIPSRYNSNRFPGKPLVDIMGKSMIQRVYEQAKKCKLLNKVIVATDDERISFHVILFYSLLYTVFCHLNNFPVVEVESHECHMNIILEVKFYD